MAGVCHRSRSTPSRAALRRIGGAGDWHLFGIQSLINIAVNMGFAPTKGLTLPLMSYGGSGMIASLVTLSVLLRIDWENRRPERGSRYERHYRATAAPADDGRRHRRLHLPGLAVARAMRERGWRVSWLGTPTGMEQTLVPQDIFRLHSIAFEGIVGRGLKPKLLLPFRMLRAHREAGACCVRSSPDVVIGMGGYPTVPGGLAAARMGIPVDSPE